MKILTTFLRWVVHHPSKSCSEIKELTLKGNQNMTILPARYAHIRWKAEAAEQWVHESFTWTDRDSYLAWVAEWKAELKERIKAIREQKAIRRDKSQEIIKRNAANENRQHLRIICANLFLLRQMAKELSATQRNKVASP